MEIELKQGSIETEAADLIVVNLFQGVTRPGGATGAVDRALGGAVSAMIAAGDFSGRAGETALLYTRGTLPAPRVLVAGLGEASRFGPTEARNASASALRRARELGTHTVATIVHGAGIGGMEPVQAAAMLVEGSRLGLYRFAGYRSALPNDWRADPERLIVVEMDTGRLDSFRRGVVRGEIVSQGVMQARDMVNQPANYMTPTAMAAVAQEMAGHAGLRCEVLGRDEMAKLGMGILLAVAAESEQPPQFVVLEHNAGREDLPTVVLAGKGVTFDSGGISLKKPDDMWRMKGDMAGAAAVIAALGVAGRLHLPVRAVGLAPCAENLPGGRAQKPGDVFTGMTGKTMEVISTDAEGRMLLADALAYAGRFRPAAVVDIATLTGTQAMAFGPQSAAFFANDDVLAARLVAAASGSGDRLWQMPLYDEYAEAIKSQVADVKNSGGRSGGIGSSAKFLQHFTEGYPWAHIDMASMALAEDDKPAQPKGATGYGVRLFTSLLEAWADAPG